MSEEKIETLYQPPTDGNTVKISNISTNSPTLVNQNQNVVIDIKEKEKEILKKKRMFTLTIVLIIILIVSLLSAKAINSYYKAHFIKNEPVVEENNEEENVKNIDVESAQKTRYFSNDFKITLDHPREAVVNGTLDYETQMRKLEIAYDKQNGQEITTIENLKQGYILKISTFVTNNRNLDEITQVKKDSFVAECPNTATVFKTEETTVDGVDSRTFEVIDCNLDYKITYLVKDGINYEFAQMYKGDIGYKQFYKAQTEEIMNSLTFNVDYVDMGPTETYTSEGLGFSFEHPFFSSDCCKMAFPISEKSTKLLVLGDKDNFIDENNFDGFGIFVDSYRLDTFDTYLEQQEKTFIDDYIVVRGEVPTLEDISIKVGDRDAVLLKGYSWREYTMVYVDITKKEGQGRSLIISIKNTSGDSFEKKINEILKSFKFF